MQIQRMLCAGCVVLSAAAAARAQTEAVTSFDLNATSSFNTILDGRFGEQYSGPGTRDAIMHRKPYSDADRTVVIDSLKIQNVTNQKALDITAGRMPDGTYRAFESIVVKNYEADMVTRDGRFPGLHIDHLRIAGGGWRQDRKTDVYLENIHVKGGDAVPLIIQDGIYGTVHLKNVKLTDTNLGSVQISTKGAGSIDRIIIEDSPDLSVAVMDRDDNVGEIDIINSPGARANVREFRSLTGDGAYMYEVESGKVFASSANWRQIGTIDQWHEDANFDGWAVNAPAWDGWQRSGGFVSANIQQVPEPGMLALASAGAVLLGRRRQRRR